MCKPGSACGCGGHGSRARGIASIAVACVAATAAAAFADEIVITAACVTATIVVTMTVVLVRVIRNPRAVLYRPGQALPQRTSRRVIEGRVVSAIGPPQAGRAVTQPSRKAVR